MCLNVAVTEFALYLTQQSPVSRVHAMPNNNNSYDNVHCAVIMTKVIATVHPVHLMNADWALCGRQPSDQANWLGLCVRRILAATIHIHLAIVIITQPVGWYPFYRPTEGGRLSRPKHRSRGAQPMPKAVYRSCYHDKHNCLQWDSNLGLLTPQSNALTTRPLCAANVATTHTHTHTHTRTPV